MSEYIIESEKKIPVAEEVDVVVCGCGPAGFGAAYAAAKNGANTLVIERYGALGGGITSWLVTSMPIYQIIPIPTFGIERPIAGGAFPDLIKRLGEIGGVVTPSDLDKYRPKGETGSPTWTTVDPELTKYMMQLMLEEAGTKLLLNTIVVNAIVEDEVIKGVIIENKSGRQAILSKIVIDATGDGDVAAAAGAPYEKAVGRMLPMTLSSRISNADIDKALPFLRDRARMNQLIKEAIDTGEIPHIPALRVLPEQGDRLVTINASMFNYKAGPFKWHRKGEMNAWGPHVHGDCTDVTDLTEAEVFTRDKILPFVYLLRKNVPGCEDIYLSFTSYQIGLRESRRIVGEYFLTADKDEIYGVRHKDVICRVFMGGRTKEALKSLFDIPYRCIVPLKIDNLLVAGRCISIDHKAATLLEPREENTCMILGDVAGTAATLCIKENVRPRNLDVMLLQKKLKERGYNLKEDEII